jgi:hypothetical protein
MKKTSESAEKVETGVFALFDPARLPDGYQGMLIDTVPMYHEKKGS